MKKQSLIVQLLLTITFLISSSNLMFGQQPRDNSASNMHNKILSTLSGLVTNIVIKEKDGNYVKSGTALFVKHGFEYYAVTAKHCFINGSTQAGKTLPKLENTNVEAGFMTGLNTLGKVTLLHRENLHDGKKPLFNVYYIGVDQAIDVAALKLTNPSNEVKRLSIDSHFFDLTGNIQYQDKLAIAGFPSYKDDTEDNIITTFAPKEIQEMLEQEHKYYFLMLANKDLSAISIAGFSGAAILDVDTQKIVGFVAGENKKANFIYGIYAKYMFELFK